MLGLSKVLSGREKFSVEWRTESGGLKSNLQQEMEADIVNKVVRVFDSYDTAVSQSRKGI